MATNRRRRSTFKKVDRTVQIMRASLLINCVVLAAGLTVCIIDLDEYAFGLYLVLVSLVGLIITCAFCIMGPENAKETFAKKMWSRMSTSVSKNKRRIARLQQTSDTGKLQTFRQTSRVPESGNGAGSLDASPKFQINPETTTSDHDESGFADGEGVKASSSTETDEHQPSTPVHAAFTIEHV